jgi:hypothetical protein
MEAATGMYPKKLRNSKIFSCECQMPKAPASVEARSGRIQTMDHFFEEKSTSEATNLMAFKQTMLVNQ